MCGWQGICSIWKFLEQGCKWIVGDGKNISFWKDSWLGSGTILGDVVIGAMQSGTISSMINEFGDWNLVQLNQLLPRWALNEVLGTVPPKDDLGPDRIAWGLTSHGCFSTKSAYHLVANNFSGPNHRVWKNLWNCVAPQRLKCFAWKQYKKFVVCLLSWAHGIKIPWSSLFLEALSTIWFARNRKVFSDVLEQPQVIANRIYSRTAEIEGQLLVVDYLEMLLEDGFVAL
ncbi:ribonuclease H [Sesbania bispinosa]|nr:ribonuclease H [Sesbania bispinosa]